MTRPCMVHGCDRPRESNLFCSSHESRFRKFGDPRAEVPIGRRGDGTPPGHTSVEVCKAAGVTYRQLDYWTASGLISPSLYDASGSGTQRGWSDEDVEVVRTIKGLLDLGLSLQAVRKVDAGKRRELLAAMAAVLDAGLRVAS